jgi:hypothetical protein
MQVEPSCAPGDKRGSAAASQSSILRMPLESFGRMMACLVVRAPMPRRPGAEP